MSLELILGLAFTAVAGAQHPPAAHAHVSAVHTASASVAPSETGLIGTIDKFEEAKRQLVLRTRDGRVTFVLAATAVIRMGSRVLPLGDLAKDRGRKAKVRFTISHGRRTAHWVVISSEAPAPR